MTFFFLCYGHEEGAPKDAGGFRKLWELAAHIRSMGHRVRVFAPQGQGPERTDVPATRYPLMDVPVLRPLLAYLTLFLLPLLAGFRQKPDWIVVRTGVNALPVLLKFCLRARLLMDFNGDALGEELLHVHPLKRSIHAVMEKTLARGADKIVTLTPGLRDAVALRHDVPGEKIVIIPSGTDIDRFVPLPKTESRRRVAVPPDADPVVAFLGTVYEHQGLDVLADAALLILREKPGARFLIAGDGPHLATIREKAQRPELKEAFQFLGAVPHENAPWVVGAADVCVAPFKAQRGETSPLKIFDYIAGGRPVAASRIPSVEPLGRKFPSLFLVPPEDPEALARAVLAAPGKTTEAMLQASRKAVVADHSWAGIAARVLDIVV